MAISNTTTTRDAVVRWNYEDGTPTERSFPLTEWGLFRRRDLVEAIKKRTDQTPVVVQRTTVTITTEELAEGL